MSVDYLGEAVTGARVYASSCRVPTREEIEAVDRSFDEDWLGEWKPSNQPARLAAARAALAKGQGDLSTRRFGDADLVISPELAREIVRALDDAVKFARHVPLYTQRDLVSDWAQQVRDAAGDAASRLRRVANLQDLCSGDDGGAA